jgi:hypothetical protein
MPDTYSLGSEEEALISLKTLGEAWVMHSKAFLWLIEQVGGPRVPSRYLRQQ